MKLGILSDSHDKVDNVGRALDEFRKRRVSRIIHCGDITSPETAELFQGWMADFVLGNCDWNPDGLESTLNRMGATLHRPFGQLELSGKIIAWIHSDDLGLFRSLENADHYDFLFYGHTHIAEQHQTGKTLVCNPGALQRARVKSCAVLNLDTGRIEPIPITK